MGRPREFDIDRAVDVATELFWRSGYDGASISDLTDAIGITAPSFYFAFGSKEELFRRVITRYYDSYRGLAEAACEEAHVRDVIAKVLFGYADVLTDASHAPGCLALNSALPCNEDHPLRLWLAELREEMRIALRDRFAKERDSAQRGNMSAEVLSRLVVSLAWGIAVEAQSGTSRKELHRAINAALALWPEPAAL